MFLRKAKMLLTKVFRRGKLLEVKEVAERLAISNKTVYNHLYTHKLKGVKKGKHWRISEDELAKLL